MRLPRGCFRPSLPRLAMIPLIALIVAGGCSTAASGPAGEAPAEVPAVRPGEVAFFGVGAGAEAKRIVYLVDSCGSMIPSFAFVQAELARSIETLRPGQEFHVVFFADNRAMELAVNGRLGLQPADEQSRKAAIAWIENHEAESWAREIDHRPAIKAALAPAGGPPDTVFLLTSGPLMGDDPAGLIEKLNADGKIRVNTMTFYDRWAEKQLRSIAERSGGTYRHVDEEAMRAGEISFFGIRAGENTERVVYVVDKSGSMFDTFAYVQDELTRSVRELGPKQKFHVVFFSDGGQPTEFAVQGKARLRYPDIETRRLAIEWIEEQYCESLASPLDAASAVKRAIEVEGGPPDAIYLLTDGILLTEAVETIDRINRGGKVRIHTIAFISRVGEAALRKIAEQSGGRYRFIEVEELDIDY